LSSDFSDFEDAIQYYTALDNKLEIIITRNKKDFKKSKLPDSVKIQTENYCIV